MQVFAEDVFPDDSRQEFLVMEIEKKRRQIKDQRDERLETLYREKRLRRYGSTKEVNISAVERFRDPKPMKKSHFLLTFSLPKLSFRSLGKIPFSFIK